MNDFCGHYGKLKIVTCINRVLKGETSKMYKKRIICLALLSVLLCVTVFCQVAYSEDTVLTVDDLPTAGESLVIESDSVLTVNEDETAAIEGALSINGADDAIINVEIINYGELTIKSSSIRCNHANFTIQNQGTLTVQTSDFVVVGNSTLNLGNTVDCSLTDTSFEVLGGYAYLQNVGSLTVHNGYFKDQFDGTFITNYGEAILSECNFVVNGAEGKIELFNNGDMQLRHGVFDVNYGGKVNLNTLTGTLTMDDCSMDVSGWSHGKKSEVNLLIGNSTWESCEFVNNGGLINCLNTGEVNVNNCTVSMSSVNASTILSSSGPMVFEKFVISGSGSVSITNWDSMTLIDADYASSNSLTLMNNGELATEDWLVKTTSNAARIVVYNGDNGSIAFNVPFIEDVSTEVLTSIGPDGQKFVDSSGGTITVTNLGSMNKQSSTDAIGLEFIVYILIIVAAVAVSIFVILKNRKKPRTSS